MILSMLILAAALNWLVTSHQMILGFYALPTLISAYVYGRRHATLTAVASVGLVGILAWSNNQLLPAVTDTGALPISRWYGLFSWGAILILTAYAMGTLHERHKNRVAELRQTYHGVLLILRQFVAKDKYTENHSYRVSVYAAKIAARMGFASSRIDDIRAAALLHDIGKLDVSRQLLYKASILSSSEVEHIGQHEPMGGDILDPVGGPLRRILPAILAHHEKYDGSGDQALRGEEIPVEARIIAVADVYDALTSDRPYRKAMSSFEARDIILKGSGVDFDPAVVQAFQREMDRNGMEVPEIFL